MALRLLDSRHFSISRCFSAQARDDGVSLPAAELLIPGWIDSKLKGLTHLVQHGSRSTDSVVGGAFVSRRFLRFLAWVAGLIFTAMGTIASAAAELPAIPASSTTFTGPISQLIINCKKLDRFQSSLSRFLRLTCNSD